MQYQLKFLLLQLALKALRVNVYVTIFFYLTVTFFVLKLRESLLKSLKITLKRLQNPYWGAGKLLIHRKILFERNNFAKNDLHTP